MCVHAYVFLPNVFGAVAAVLDHLLCPHTGGECCAQAGKKVR